MDVLIVEDDELLGRALYKGLVEAGHACRRVQSGQAGLDEAGARAWHAIILDLMLPELPGSDVLARLRASGNRTPVLILTALGSVDQRVAGLQAGADDYLVKPFAFPELLARLDAITRRSIQSQLQQLTVGPLCLDLTTRRVVREGTEVDLTPTEFSLLEFFLRHAGQVVTRRMICEHLWDADWEGITNVIEVHVNRLRSKIDRDFAVPLLHTVRGRGYILRAG
jgi:two-component system OmpR family response regulator/two-component system copper resistance phosphate regulon response regulator CusR